MDEDIKKAEEQIEYLSSDPKTLELYKAREKSLHERANMISSARDEGRVEEKIVIAKNLLQMGMDILTVVKATGLSEEDIRKIKESMN